jgi:hypothetical protein
MKNTTHLFYLLPTPDDSDDVKVGITRLEVSQIRLGTYQQALGPRLMARWEVAWIGEQTEIEAMEREVKKEFRKDILYEGRGYSEWVSGYSAHTIKPVIQEIIDGFRFKVTLVAAEHLPITVDNLPQVQERYLNEQTT